jgi:DNA-binding NarL/FixJ family response regulator
VFCLIAGGSTITDISDQLSLSVKTISTYRSRILAKLNLKTNADLARYAVQHCIVE